MPYIAARQHWPSSLAILAFALKTIRYPVTAEWANGKGVAWVKSSEKKTIELTKVSERYRKKIVAYLDEHYPENQGGDADPRRAAGNRLLAALSQCMTGSIFRMRNIVESDARAQMTPENQAKSRGPMAALQRKAREAAAASKKVQRRRGAVFKPNLNLSA